MTAISHILRKTADERYAATAKETDAGLMVVAKISRSDAHLMRRAADEIELLDSQLRRIRENTLWRKLRRLVGLDRADRCPEHG